MTAFATLIGAAELAALDPDSARVFDCRFDLADPDAGEARFTNAHIPGAVYLHLDRDLAGPVSPGRTGRHPLPDRDAFRERLRAHGVAEDSQVVAYDDAGGMFAARCWWMVRWAGHARVAVLDGGYHAWQAMAAGTPGTMPASLPPPPEARPTTVTMPELRSHVVERTWTLLDARAPDRFDGSNETIDPRGGHIPGARNAPFADNLTPDGRFADRASLRRRFESLLAGSEDRRTVCYCGSGVTAAHNILAMVHAGLSEPTLYPGSWSEWITDPDNPIET
ncbi:MAG: sulfurtransferase [Gammaproteobacteria bacterium]|nr:sulfurtransferase [Gammaproteobacteria bacterium]